MIRFSYCANLQFASCQLACFSLCVTFYEYVRCLLNEILENSSTWIRTFPVEWRNSRTSTPWPWSLLGVFAFILICEYLVNVSHTHQEIEHTLLKSSDRKSGICHRMALLRILYVVTLTSNFKVTKFRDIYKYTISGKWCELTKTTQVRPL